MVGMPIAITVLPKGGSVPGGGAGGRLLDPAAAEVGFCVVDMLLSNCGLVDDPQRKVDDGSVVGRGCPPSKLY